MQDEDAFDIQLDHQVLEPKVEIEQISKIIQPDIQSPTHRFSPYEETQQVEPLTQRDDKTNMKEDSLVISEALPIEEELDSMLIDRMPEPTPRREAATTHKEEVINASPKAVTDRGEAPTERNVKDATIIREEVNLKQEVIFNFDTMSETKMVTEHEEIPAKMSEP